MRKISCLSFVVLSILLSLVSCKKETAETVVTLSGKWACADGGLITGYLDFSGNTVTKYTADSALPFVDGCIWTYSSEKFNAEKNEYTIKDNILYVGGVKQGSLRIFEETLIIDGNQLYEKVKDLNPDYYSSITPGTTSMKVGYAHQFYELEVSVSRALSSASAVLSATSDKDWLPSDGISFSRVKGDSYLLMFEVTEDTTPGNATITISYPGAKNVQISVERTSLTSIQLDAVSKEISALGGAYSVGYTISNPIGENKLEATSDQSWLTINVAPKSQTNGVIEYVAEENTSGAERTAVITCTYIGAESVTHTVKQNLLTVEDLSANGTANCYIVNKAGNYKFKADVKGKSSESVGTPASAETLWETYGTTAGISAGTIIKDVRLLGGYVNFSTNATLAAGNAAIAVKDASGTILWSWHIWVCPGFDPASSAQVYKNGAGTFMDRNLGATSADPSQAQSYGLLYQWGRKDPFLGAANLSTKAPAASSTTWPTAKDVSECLEGGSNTLAFSIKNPMLFIKGGTAAGAATDFNDWYATSEANQNNNLWSTELAKYDPCPLGWKVPEGGKSGRYATAYANAGSEKHQEWWNNTYFAMNLGGRLSDATSVWYAALGTRHGTSGALTGQGANGTGYFWTGTAVPSSDAASDTRAASMFRIRGGASYYDIVGSVPWHRSMAYSVRCVSENSPAIQPVTGINISKTEMNLAPGASETLTIVAQPTNANLTTLTVTSSSTAAVTVTDAGNGNYTVKGVAAGTSTITAKSYNEISVTCVVTVKTDTPITDYTDLSKNGTANCYYITAPGKYRFKATVRGNGVTTSCGLAANITGIANIYEYWKDGATVVSGYELKEGYVCFNVSSVDKAGTSLVAVRDAQNNILWSWHVWVNKEIKSIDVTNTNGVTTTWLNMNLGAHQVEWNDEGYMGYYYQWGRKDPIQQKKTTADMGTPWQSYASKIDGSIENSILYPERFYGSYKSDASGQKTISDWAEFNDAGKLKYDWWCQGLTGATSTGTVKKTMFDPCPVGYNVPGNDDISAIGKDLVTRSFTNHCHVCKGTNGDVYFPTISFRSAGVNEANGDKSVIYWKGETSDSPVYLWSAFPGQATLPDKVYAHRAYLRGISSGTTDTNIRAYGVPVRCVKTK